MADQPLEPLPDQLIDIGRQEEPAQYLSLEGAVVLAKIANLAALKVDMAGGDHLLAALALVVDNRSCG
jgi:hypothetical protein